MVCKLARLYLERTVISMLLFFNHDVSRYAMNLELVGIFPSAAAVLLAGVLVRSLREILWR